MARNKAARFAGWSTPVEPTEVAEFRAWTVKPKPVKEPVKEPNRTETENKGTNDE